MQYEDITRRIIGCAMTVHSTLGNGFQELIYQRALDYLIYSLQINHPLNFVKYHINHINHKNHSSRLNRRVLQIQTSHRKH